MLQLPEDLRFTVTADGFLRCPDAIEGAVLSVSTVTGTASAAETHGGNSSTIALLRSASKMLACSSTPAIGRDRPEVGVSTDSASPAAVTPTTNPTETIIKAVREIVSGLGLKGSFGTALKLLSFKDMKSTLVLYAAMVALFFLAPPPGGFLRILLSKSTYAGIRLLP